jgi:hypothetical protein
MNQVRIIRNGGNSIFHYYRADRGFAISSGRQAEWKVIVRGSTVGT